MYRLGRDDKDSWLFKAAETTLRRNYRLTDAETASLMPLKPTSMEDLPFLARGFLRDVGANPLDAGSCLAAIMSRAVEAMRVGVDVAEMFKPIIDDRTASA